MKKFALISLIAFILIACAYEGIAPVNSSPAREIYYKFETGERIGVRSLSYDGNGNLVREYYSEDANPLANDEILYEYDAENHLVKRKQRQPEITIVFFIIEWTYENGMRKSQTTYLDNNPMGYRDLYFYAGTRLDSSQMFAYSTIDHRYNLIGTTHYAYDAHGRLEHTRYGDGRRTKYHYNRNLLIATCDLLEGEAGATFEDCVNQEYNEAGQLIKVSSSNPWLSQLKEELFYRAGRLDEKRVYSYPSYDPDNRIVITQIRYEY